MPCYEYGCSKCDKVSEQHRTIADRHRVEDCECGGSLERLVEIPTVSIWNTERLFSNVAPTPVAFDTENDYKVHCAENHMQETAIDGLNYRPHGNRVVMTDGNETERGGLPDSAASRGRWASP